MTQTQPALLHNIVDLTENDSHDFRLEALSAAAARAAAAAIRLSNSFESLTSAPSRNRPEQRIGGRGEIVPPENYARSATMGHNGHSDKDAAPSSRTPSSDTRIRSVDTEPRSETQRKQEPSPAIGGRLAPESSPMPALQTQGDVTHTTAGRPSRPAAQAAGRVIAQTYDILNPLEAQQQAKTTPPRKPGRPKIDQWTPTSHSSRSSPKTGKAGEERDGSPFPRIAQQLDETSRGEKEAHLIANLKGVGPALNKKRKRGSLSPEAGPSTRQGATEVKRFDLADISKNDMDNVAQKRDIPFLSKGIQEPQGNRATHARAEKESLPSSIPISSAPSGHLNYQEISLGQASSRSESAEQTSNAFLRRIQGPKELPEPCAQTDMPPDMAALSRLYADKVFPAIKKAQKRHENQSSEGELNSIGKDVAAEVVGKKLRRLSPADLLQPSHSQKKDIKKFTKELYHEKVLKSSKAYKQKENFGARSPEPSNIGDDEHFKRAVFTKHSDSAYLNADHRVSPSSTDGRPPLGTQETKSTAQTAKITNLSEYIKKLETETLSTDLDIFENPSPVCVPASPDKEELNRSNSDGLSSAPSTTNSSRVDCDTLHTHREDSLMSRLNVSPAARPQVDLDLSPESSFPPGFDRGRYPAQRRRRANKFYTPDRMSAISRNSHAKSTIQDTHIRSVPKPKFVKMARNSIPGYVQRVSKEEISQRLITRVATDPQVKALFEIVATGNASPAQFKAFQELRDELGQSESFGGIPESLRGEVDYSRVESYRGREPNRPYSQTASSQPTTPESRSTSPLGWSGLHSQGSVMPLTRKASAQQPHKLTRSSRPDIRPHRNIVQQRAQEIDQVPVSRKLATAHDPYLERTVAETLINEPGTFVSVDRGSTYRISQADQEAVVHQPTVMKYAGPVFRQKGQGPSDSAASTLVTVETKVIDPAWKPIHHTASLLRARELGLDSRNRNIEIHSGIRLRQLEKLRAWRYWKGASGDVVAAAWGPDSTTYAVGAAAHTNPEDVQYNRPYNLLLGDICSNTLTELPDHRLDRPKPETLSNTDNARQGVYDACDPMIYMTISSIAFSPQADRMYSASHDHTVKIWDISSAQKRCLQTLYHDANVTSVEVSTVIPGLFATASSVIDKSIRVYYGEDTQGSSSLHTDFSASRAQANQRCKIYPECIRWSPNPSTSHLLLAGFRQWDHADGQVPKEGQLCLWDANALKFIKVTPFSQSVLAATWHPTWSMFATGGAPGSMVSDKQNTKTVVRTWDVRRPERSTMEYECSASDMQDITFHPTDGNIITAGCTDGTSFVWDYRWPESPIHRLKHGTPLLDWDHTRRREEVDTGVMMSLWGLYGSLFYTGSSDGMVKAWDVRRHPDDVLHSNVAKFGAGIQSGALSPDGVNMLVGDAEGGVHVLSSAPCGHQPEDSSSDYLSPEVPITIIRDPTGGGMALNDDDPGNEGRDAAQKLIDTSELEFDSELGVTQGRRYNGPYGEYWRDQAQGQVFQPKPFNNTALSYSNESGIAEPKQFYLRTHRENQEVENMRRDFIAARKQKILQLYPNSQAAKQASVQHKPPRVSTPGSADRSPPKSGLVHGTSRFSTLFKPKSTIPAKRPSSAMTDAGISTREESSDDVKCVGSSDEVIDNIIPEHKMIEENYWWPDLGRLEIEEARRLVVSGERASKG